jgi:hypothetical protein
MAKSTKIFIIVLVSMIFIPVSMHIVRKYNREKNIRYTIGITQGEHFADKTYHEIRFIYFINNRTIMNGDVYDYKAKAFNGRYFVKYDSLHPSNAVLLQDFPVPDSIKTAPPNGWKEIPVKRPVN